MYNANEAIESHASWVELREQTLQMERLLREENRRVRNLEQELRFVECLPEQYMDQSARMEEVLDNQLEMEEVLIQKVNEVYNRLEEKQIERHDLVDTLHERTKGWQAGLRTIKQLEQECHDLRIQKNDWKDKYSEKESELSEANAKIQSLEEALSHGRGPGWDLRLPVCTSPGSEELGSGGEDVQTQFRPNIMEHTPQTASAETNQLHPHAQERVFRIHPTERRWTLPHKMLLCRY
jgi:hypothetical protein